MTIEEKQTKQAPWPFPINNGHPLLPAKKFDPSNWRDELL